MTLFLSIVMFAAELKTLLNSRFEDSLNGEPCTVPKDSYNNHLFATATPMPDYTLLLHWTSFPPQKEGKNQILS